MPGKSSPREEWIDRSQLNVGPVDYARIRPDIANRLSELRYVPFEVQPDQGASYVAGIDPGPIPPTFCHSWALDLEGISRFRLRVDNAVTALNFDDGDDVKIYAPESGQSVHFSNETELRTHWVDLDTVPGSNPPRVPTRIYIVLRTSPARYAEGQSSAARRMRLLGLTTEVDSTTAHAWLVGDTLNHTPTTPVSQQYWLLDGRGHKLPQPWRPAGGVSSIELIDEPKPQDGWYLLGRFTSYQAGDDTPIWAVVHYNEQRSRVRVHIWSEVENASGLEVRLKLLGQDPARATGYLQLEGAFFDEDQRTQTWSEGILVVTDLVEREWRMVETDVLFPMAKSIPGTRDATLKGPPPAASPSTAGSGSGTSAKAGSHVHHESVPPVGDWYVPVYDSIAEAQLRSVRLQVAITAFTRGEASLDFIGKGVGTAAQNMADSGDPMLTVLKNAAKEGISAGKAGKELYKALKEWYEKEHGKGAPLTGLLALGGSAFGAVGAAVGAGIAIYKTLTAKAAKMELELRIRGSVSGSIYTSLATTVFECYLPGRFDAEEMHGRDGIALNHPHLDQWIPRYDRTIGHIGFRYDPTEIACRAVYFGPHEEEDAETSIAYDDYLWEWCMRCVWPAPRIDDRRLRFPFKLFDEASRSQWRWDSTDHPAQQDAFIPLVLNEFAEIVSIDPAGSSRVLLGGSPPDDPHQQTHQFIGKIGFALHVTPEKKDKTFPADAEAQGSVGGWSMWAYHGSDWLAYDSLVEDHIEIDLGNSDRVASGVGYWLDAGPGVKPLLLRDFDPYRGLQTEDFGQLSVVLYDESYANAGPPVKTKEFLGKDLAANHYRPFAPGSPWPIADLLYRWELVYLYYGRTRQQPSGAVPRRHVSRMLRAPVTVDVMRWDCDWRMEEFAWHEPGGSGRSVMLTESPWP